MYRIIADRLRSKIESGELRGGQQLPTELELREEYDASRNTVRDAVKSLVNQGLVEAFPGRGTFVKVRVTPFLTTLTQDQETGFGGGEGEAFVREVRSQQRRPSVSPPRVEIQGARPEVAAALGLEEGAPVISRHQLRYIDDLPWSLETSFYSRELVQRGAERLADPTDIQEGTVRYLADAIGVEQAGYEDKLRVRPANRYEEIFFELRGGSQRSVLEKKRTAYDGEGRPIRLTVSTFHPDRAEIAVRVGSVPPRRNTQGLVSQRKHSGETRSRAEQILSQEES